MKSIKKFLILFLAVIPFLFACEQDKDFAYDMDLLVGTEWGTPQVNQGSYSLAAPTVFEEDGTVTFGGTHQDTWDVRDSRSLFIQRRSEIWQVLTLTETRLEVDILKYPDGQFKASCVYRPIE
jgi:hypothetical protein